MKIPKRAKRIGITALSMFIAIFIAGFIYAYYSDRSPAADSAKKPTDNYQPLPPPPKPAADDKEGASIESLDSPVTPGQNTSMIIQTNATSNCDISLSYGSLKATDSGLVQKTANAYGIVTWTWTVPANAPLGNWPVNVTCHFNKQSAVVIGNLQVTMPG